MMTTRSRSWRWLGVLAVVSALASACGDDGGETGDAPSPGGDEATGDTGGTGATGTTEGDSGAGAEGEVQPGGSLTLISQTDPRSLDPALVPNANSTGGPVVSAIFGHLYTLDKETGEFIPGIATSFETTDDGTTWELSLREGVVFSDGSPLDAEAVKFSWERMADPELGSPNIPQVLAIDSMTVVDATTLEVVLTEPNSNWDQQIPLHAMNWIVPPGAVQELGDQFGNEPVGAGPFVLESRTPDAETVLRRNPDYWAEGKPYLDELRLVFNTDAQAALDTILAGQAAAFANPSDLIVQRAQENGLEITQFLTDGGVNWTMNSQMPPFDEVRARRAVVLAVDGEAINQAVFEGAVDVPDTLIPESSPLYRESATVTQPDPEAAQALFDELADEGTPVEFTIMATNTGESRATGQAIVTQLREYDNVSVELEQVDAATYAQRVFVDQDFQMTNAGVIGPDPEPAFYDWLHSEGARNVIGIGDPAIDEALERGRTETDPEARADAYADLVEAVNEQAPNIWIYRKWHSIMHTSDTTGWDMSAGGTPIYDDVGFIS